MTLTEAARVLGVTHSTLRNQVHNGKLRAKKVGRDWHVTPSEVERYRRQHLRQRDGTEER
jgi:excisionase family DNA binding protein